MSFKNNVQQTDYNALFNQLLALTQQLDKAHKDDYESWLCLKIDELGATNYKNTLASFIKVYREMGRYMNDTYEELKREKQLKEYLHTKSPVPSGPYNMKKFVELTASLSTVKRALEEGVISPSKNNKGEYVFSEDNLREFYKVYPKYNPDNGEKKRHTKLEK